MQKSLDLFDQIEIERHVSAFLQIANTVLFAVASGRIKGGDRLPSAGALAKHLDLNINTIAKAYRDLEVMGVTYTRRGMGVYVKDDAQKQCQVRVRSEILTHLHQVIAEAKAAGMAGAEVRAAVKACLASDAKIYGPAPKEVLARAKGK
jgi:GntR family transcriptional regulator